MFSQRQNYEQKPLFDGIKQVRRQGVRNTQSR